MEISEYLVSFFPFLLKQTVICDLCLIYSGNEAILEQFVPLYIYNDVNPLTLTNNEISICIGVGRRDVCRGVRCGLCGVFACSRGMCGLCVWVCVGVRVCVGWGV